MREDFRFDTSICEKCEHKSKEAIHATYFAMGFYCWAINDYISWSGQACNFNTRTDLTLKDIQENYDPRVEKCPYKLEHVIRADEKRKS